MFYCIRAPITPPVRTVSSQQGSALIVALVFLLAMTLIGVAAMQGTSQQELMAGNAYQRNLAFQAAEAALRVSERSLVTDSLPAFDNTRCLFDSAQTMTTDSGTFWMDFDWSACQPVTGLGEVGAQPRYAIEDLGVVALQPKDSSQKVGAPLSEIHMYRLTARGQDTRAAAVVILQSLYKRPL